MAQRERLLRRWHWHQRCEQINNQRGFGLEFPETKACYENLKAKRVHNGACLREPVSIVTAGYGAGAARG